MSSIHPDHQRFREIVRGKIKQNLRKYISKGDMIGKQGKEQVTIPLPQIDIPHFRFGGKEQGGVGQGKGDVGQPIAPGDPQEGDGKGKAGEGAGEHSLEVDVTLDELAKILGEELRLPNIEPKGKKNIERSSMRYTTIRKVGPESLRHFKRTFRRALYRQIASGSYNPEQPIIVPVRDDKRYRSGQVVLRPEANAVIIYIMDVSGCHTKGHLIELADGGYKDVSEISVGDRVACVDVAQQKKTTSVVTETFQYHVSETVLLKTDDHVGLRVTPEHRYFVYDEPNNEIIEKHAKDIKIGDKLILINKHGSEATSWGDEISEDEAYLVGALTGDGHITENNEYYSRSIVLTDLSLVRLGHYRDLFKSEFGIDGIIKEATDDPNSRSRLFVNSAHLVRQFSKRYPALRERSPMRYIEPRLFSQSPNVRAAYLRGLFDAEGSVGGHAAHFYSTSEQLAKQVKLLLSFWGIRARITKKVQLDRDIKGHHIEGGRPYYHLSINAKDVLLFAKFVGFRCKTKQAKLQELSDQQSEMKNAMRSRYISKKLIREELSTIPSIEKIKSRLYETDKNSFSEANLLRMSKFADPAQASLIKETLENRFIVSEVQSVLFLSEPVDVYDFTVEKHNNYIVDGILSHNSMGDEQKEIVRIESFWLDTWLKSQYKGLETRFIIHDAVAREVDRDTFFKTRESGGTMISSAYKLCAKIIEDDYPAASWNIYPFHFSDGDNWSAEDSRLCVQILRDRVLPRSNQFSYGQVESPYGSGQFIKDLKENFGKDERVATSEIKDKDAIIDSIKDFLSRGR